MLILQLRDVNEHGHGVISEYEGIRCSCRRTNFEHFQVDRIWRRHTIGMSESRDGMEHRRLKRAGKSIVHFEEIQLFRSETLFPYSQAHFEQWNLWIQYVPMKCLKKKSSRLKVLTRCKSNVYANSNPSGRFPHQLSEMSSTIEEDRAVTAIAHSLLFPRLSLLIVVVAVFLKIERLNGERR